MAAVIVFCSFWCLGVIVLVWPQGVIPSVSGGVCLIAAVSFVLVCGI